MQLQTCGFCGDMLNWSSWRYQCVASTTTDWVAAAVDLAQTWMATGFASWLALAPSDYKVSGFRVYSFYSTFPYFAAQQTANEAPGTHSGSTGANGLGGRVNIIYTRPFTGKVLTQAVWLPGAPDSEIDGSQITPGYLALMQSIAAAIKAPINGSLTTWNLFPGRYSPVAPGTLIDVQALPRISALRRRMRGG